MWREIEYVRDAVFRMIEEVVPRSVSYVLTNALEDDSEALLLFRADQKHGGQSRFVVLARLRMTCDVHEQLRRIPGPERTQRMKMDDPEKARSYIENTTFFVPNDENLLTMDTHCLRAARYCGVDSGGTLDEGWIERDGITAPFGAKKEFTTRPRGRRKACERARGTARASDEYRVRARMYTPCALSPYARVLRAPGVRAA